mmetsp:Transcript_37346/g.90687  ORF Transcript_37346/g.90687 Transcript_37346/m.90687 type:complete len:297 (-) Transcript_37346:302-1192(-)
MQDRMLATTAETKGTVNFIPAVIAMFCALIIAYKEVVKMSKDTFFVTVYGTCFRIIGLRPLTNPATPSRLRIFCPPFTKPSGAKSGSATIRIRRASIGHNMTEAENPDTTPESKNANNDELKKPMDVAAAKLWRNDLMIGFNTSYTPNLTAPSIRYPKTVGPSPDQRTPMPSFLTSLRVAFNMLTSARSGSICFRVLTTSIGVGMACDTAAQTPPAKKYLQHPADAMLKRPSNAAIPRPLELANNILSFSDMRLLSSSVVLLTPAWTVSCNDICASLPSSGEGPSTGNRAADLKGV